MWGNRGENMAFLNLVADSDGEVMEYGGHTGPLGGVLQSRDRTRSRRGAVRVVPSDGHGPHLR